MAVPSDRADRAPAPGVLRLVQQFVNTKDLERATDQLSDTAALGGWLRETGLLEVSTTPTRDEYNRAIQLREALLQIVSAHLGHEFDESSILLVNEIAQRGGLRALLRDPLSNALEPSAGGVDGALGRIVGAVHEAIFDGTWPRLKTCERAVCRWVFYDSSKNQSGRWCSTAVCGAREKNKRAYRRRRSRAISR